MSSELPLTPEDVAEIVAILDGGGYATFELRTARFGLKVSRSGAGWTQEWDWTAGPEPIAAIAAEMPAPAVDAAGDGVAILAPLPGTFYRAPQPGAPPFVEVGAAVGAETVVGIVETMKLMNPVYAGVSGRIGAILADNGGMVAANAVLMRIDPA